MALFMVVQRRLSLFSGVKTTYFMVLDPFIPAVNSVLLHNESYIS